jgi:hypothetical protein
MAVHVVTEGVVAEVGSGALVTFPKGAAIGLTPAQESGNLLQGSIRAATFRDSTGETVAVSN